MRATDPSPLARDGAPSDAWPAGSWSIPSRRLLRTRVSRHRHGRRRCGPNQRVVYRAIRAFGSWGDAVRPRYHLDRRGVESSGCSTRGGIAKTSSHNSPRPARRSTGAGFGLVAGGLRECLATGDAHIDTAKLERLFVARLILSPDPVASDVHLVEMSRLSAGSGWSCPPSRSILGSEGCRPSTTASPSARRGQSGPGHAPASDPALESMPCPGPRQTRHVGSPI